MNAHKFHAECPCFSCQKVPRGTVIPPNRADKLGDLTHAQIVLLSDNLERAHGVKITDAPSGCFWLGTEDGGALFVRSYRTVEHITKCAKLIGEEAQKQNTQDQRPTAP